MRAANMYKKLFSCEDKVVVVTGGAGLIGAEIVKVLRDFGATVCIADLDNERSVRFAREQECKFVHLDVTSKTSVKKVFSNIVYETGKIDVLVNSAYPRTEDWGNNFENVTFGSWKDNLNNQLGGYFLCCQEAALHMKEQRKGSIINIASIYGIVGPDFSIYEGTDMTMPAAYSAIKGGLIAFTRYLAMYYGGDNIRANCISPGGIFNDQKKAFVARYCSKTPLGRMGKPNDIAGAIIYLASDASSYVTGQNIIIDGGWTVW